MNKRLAELAARRRLLLIKTALQRDELAVIAQRMQKPLRWGDKGMGALGYLRRHPMLVTGAVAALLVWRRKGIGGVALLGLGLLKLYSSPLSSLLKFIFSARHSYSEKRDAKGEH